MPDKYKQFMLEFILGGFFLGAIVLLFYFTAVIHGKSFFSDTREYQLKVEFSNVGALSVNDKVCVIGMKIGRVKSLELTGDYQKAIAVLALKKNIPFYADYEITIRNSSVFGGEFIQIHPGTKPAGAVLPGTTLKGKPPVDIINEASDLITILRRDAEKLRKVVEEENLFENISKAAKGFNEGAMKFDEFLVNLKENRGTLGKLMNDPELYDRAGNLINQVGQTNRELQKLVGKLNNGQGALGKLLAEDDAYLKLKTALDNINKISEAFSSDKGTLGKIINDNGELYGALYNSLTTAGELAEELKTGKGSLGLLMKDKELYEETLKAVKQIRAAVEDYRNQAPAATFGSMALGAF
jgi:phospholipid/cholesterol/gamma-HCH transport system substrate-binding protein